MQKAADAADIPFTTNVVGGMFGLFFSREKQISNFDQVMACNKERFNKFFHGMLDKGIYLAPSAFEAGFVSSAHTEQDIETTLNVAAEVLKTL